MTKKLIFTHSFIHSLYFHSLTHSLIFVICRRSKRHERASKLYICLFIVITWCFIVYNNIHCLILIFVACNNHEWESEWVSKKAESIHLPHRFALGTLKVEPVVIGAASGAIPPELFLLPLLNWFKPFGVYCPNLLVSDWVSK